MNKENCKIVLDSSADLFAVDDIPLAFVPLRIITEQNEYVDDGKLNVEAFSREMAMYSGKSSTACPSPADWVSAFGDAENVFCISMTGALSGSWNAACVAKADYEEQHPKRQVFVLDSLSAGPELRLIGEKIAEWIRIGKSYGQICRDIVRYRQHTGLLFVLQSMKNLANNGRVSPLTAKAAGLLGIRVVGKASDTGVLEPLQKCRGEHNALTAVVTHLQHLHAANKIYIGHCQNEGAADKLKDLLHQEFENIKVEIYRSRGLCSYYAEAGGLMIGFEKSPAG